MTLTNLRYERGDFPYTCALLAMLYVYLSLSGYQQFAKSTLDLRAISVIYLTIYSTVL